MIKTLKGKVWKFGDDVDTDVIIPAKYCNISNPDELARYCMSGIDEDFVNKVGKGDLILGGENFGCGSSREVAPVSIKACGVSCVIAKSFARIFFRNSINIGLPVLECAEIIDETDEGDEVEVDLGSARIKNITKDEDFRFKPFPKFIGRIIDAGGLLNFLKGRI